MNKNLVALLILYLGAYYESFSAFLYFDAYYEVFELLQMLLDVFVSDQNQGPT